MTGRKGRTDLCGTKGSSVQVSGTIQQVSPSGYQALCACGQAYLRLRIVNLVPNLIPKSKKTGQGARQGFMCRNKSLPQGIRRLAPAVRFM